MNLKVAGLIFSLVGLVTVSALADDITISLSGGGSVSHHRVSYTCDASGSQMGLPSGAFEVDYINGGGNSLAVVPMSGKSLIFVNVLSASGARYVAQQFTWWDAKGSVAVSSMTNKMQSTCRGS